MSSDAKPSSPALPIKTRLKIAALSAITDYSRRSDGTINRRLLSILDPPIPPSSTPIRNVITSDHFVDPSINLFFRLFTPTSDADADPNLPVIVFFHGGGFAFLSPSSRTYDAVCRRIARKIPALVLSVNYRLAPEHRCPAPYDDGISVLKFLDSNSLPSVPNLTNVFLAGDSAGGNIAHHVAARWAADTTWSRLHLRGVFIIQPYFGGEEVTSSEARLDGFAPIVSKERTDWLWTAFLPEGATREHEAVNVFGPESKALPERFPPAAVVVGGFDPLQDWQRRYYEGLRTRGRNVRLIEYVNAIHAFYVFPEIEESRLLMDDIRRFIEEHSVKAL